MKNVTMMSALCVVVLSAAGYLGYKCLSNSSENDLFMANVEALSEGEETPMLDCSETVRTAGCYRKWKYGEMWVCESIKEVRSYRVAVGSPIICHHDVVTDCPDDTYER